MSLLTTPWNCYTSCSVQPFRNEGRVNRLFFQVQINGISYEAYIDTGAPFVQILDDEIIEFLELQPDPDLLETKISIRGNTIKGFIDKVQIGFFDEMSEITYLYNFSVFFPNIWEEPYAFNETLPGIILGFHGALEHIGFGFQPRHDSDDLDKFWFSSEPS